MAIERSSLAEQLAALGVGQPRVPAPVIASAAPAVESGGGLLSKILGAGGGEAGAAGVGAVAKSAAFRGAGLGGLGMLAGQFVPENKGTSLDSGLRGALTGAGIGAGIGSAIPIPGVGTALGAGVGALAGGAIGLFGPKDDSDKPEAIQSEITKQNATLAKVLQPFQFTPDTQQLFMAQLQSALAQAKDTAGVQAAYQQIAQAIPQFVQQDLQVKAQQKDTEDRQARAAAMQAMLAPYLQQSNDQSMQFAQQLSQANKSAAGFVSDPALRSSYESQAAAIPAQAAQSNKDAIVQLMLADAAQRAEAERAQRQQQLAYGQLDTTTQDSIQQQLLRQQATTAAQSPLFGGK